jgi:hypothetical protein
MLGKLPKTAFPRHRLSGDRIVSGGCEYLDAAAGDLTPARTAEVLVVGMAVGHQAVASPPALTRVRMLPPVIRVYRPLTYWHPFPERMAGGAFPHPRVSELRVLSPMSRWLGFCYDPG